MIEYNTSRFRGFDYERITNEISEIVKGLDFSPDGKYLVQIKSAEISKNVLKELYENWLMEKTQNIFEGKVNRYSKKMGVKVKCVTIKNLRHRWGSLTKRSTININLNLIKSP
jgi:predicted metal-dependent hydrolase